MESDEKIEMADPDVRDRRGRGGSRVKPAFPCREMPRAVAGLSDEEVCAEWRRLSDEIPAYTVDMGRFNLPLFSVGLRIYRDDEAERRAVLEAKRRAVAAARRLGYGRKLKP